MWLPSQGGRPFRGRAPPTGAWGEADGGGRRDASLVSYTLTQALGGLYHKTGMTVIDYQADTIQVILCGAACNVDSVRHTAVFVGDVTLDEYGAVTGYSRKTLATKTLTLSSTNNGQAVFSSDPIVYTTLAPSKLVTKLLFFKNVGSVDATSPLLFSLDLTVAPSQTFNGTNNDVTLTPPAGGWGRDANTA